MAILLILRAEWFNCVHISWIHLEAITEDFINADYTERVSHPRNTTRKMQKSTTFSTDKLCQKSTGILGVQFSDLI